MTRNQIERTIGLFLLVGFLYFIREALFPIIVAVIKIIYLELINS